MEKHEKLPMLRVVQVGNPDFQRYLIEDEQNRLWTGEKFGQMGVLYADHNHAAADAHQILKNHFKGVKPPRYVVPLFVEVFSHEPVLVAEVVRHLFLASHLSLNIDDHGHGPGGSLVLPMIDWDRIKEVKEFSHE